MIKSKKTYKDFVLSNYPREVTAGHLQDLLKRGDPEAKSDVVDFIYHRLNHRYLEPLQHVPRKYKSGFLMMASACLMIETMEAFYYGRKTTPQGAGTKTFAQFFERESDLFLGFAADARNFYAHIRCGILRQAETGGGYRILRDGPLFDVGEKAINADYFVKALRKSLDRYVAALRRSESDSTLWRNAQKKVGFISQNCQT
jgi:hypothetical protein